MAFRSYVRYYCLFRSVMILSERMLTDTRHDVWHKYIDKSSSATEIELPFWLAFGDAPQKTPALQVHAFQVLLDYYETIDKLKYTFRHSLLIVATSKQTSLITLAA